MAEKRFSYNVNKNTIECDGKFVAYVNCVDGFRIANKLSVLSNENEQLKSEIEKLSYANEDLLSEKRNWQRMSDEYCKLSEKNEQLKQFKSRVFNLLQDEIREESELLDYYLKEKAPCNADRQQIIIGVLKRLQKELQK